MFLRVSFIIFLLYHSFHKHHFISFQKKLLFAPHIRVYVHHEIQQLVQGTMLPVLHQMDKKGSKFTQTTLRLRVLTADWTGGREPVGDIKAYSKKMGPVSAVHPARVVGPSNLQLKILRSELRALYDEKSKARQKSSFFGKPDLDKGDIQAFERFYFDSFFYPYLLEFERTLQASSDLSYLWYRELYLDATRCVQFPIDTSVPWLLTEHVIRNQAGVLPVIENVFHTLDIYNDAAYTALYRFEQQFLYDEIEAETNLVFDQFVIALSEEVYLYYKNIAAYSLLDADFKNTLSSSGKKSNV